MFEKKKTFYILKLIITFILFYGSVVFENTLTNRLYIFIGIYILYIITGLLRYKKEQNKIILAWSFLADILLIFSFEYNSRYLINYYLHFFYIIVILESFLWLDIKNSVIVSSICIFVSSIKFIILLYYKYSLGNLSQMLFFTLINIFTLFIVYFAKYYREEKLKKDKLYSELIEYSEKVEELAIVEERNRIARDIHDTLGHSITGMIMEIEMIDTLLLEEDSERAKEMVNRLKIEARDSLVKVREVVETLKPSESEDRPVTQNPVKALIDNFVDSTNVEVSYNIEGDFNAVIPTTNIVLYRMVQEALTNGVRHGKATNFHIEIKYYSDLIVFYIKDNGIGFKNLEKGFGLKNMEERINTLNGQVVFSSENGFIIQGFIPLGVEYNDKSFNS